MLLLCSRIGSQPQIAPRYAFQRTVTKPFVIGLHATCKAYDCCQTARHRCNIICACTQNPQCRTVARQPNSVTKTYCNVDARDVQHICYEPAANQPHTDTLYIMHMHRFPSTSGGLLRTGTKQPNTDTLCSLMCRICIDTPAHPDCYGLAQNIGRALPLQRPGTRPGKALP